MRGLFSSNYRTKWISKCTSVHFDVLVIGGGIAGAGIALDATTRDLKVCLLDMNDFASGTSGRSSKLIHGGLKYLTQFDVKLVSEVAMERGIIHENAPHVSRPIRVYLPLYKYSTHGPLKTKLGLTLYELLSDVNEKERFYMLSKEKVLKKCPGLKEEDLVGAASFVEYVANDARLTIETIKEAVANGAVALNYVKAIDFIYIDGKIRGVRAVNTLTGEEFEIHARRVVNASGPWMKQVGKESVNTKKHVFWTKGAHIAFRHDSFPIREGVFFESPDGRLISAIPKGDTTYVGTTDTYLDPDNLEDSVQIEDCQYLLKCVDFAFPDLHLSIADIVSSWSGIRVLISKGERNPSDLSRRDQIFVSEDGLITIAGGKLTGYRKIAERVVDTLLRDPEMAARTSNYNSLTHTMTLSGGDLHGATCLESYTEMMIKRATSQGWESDTIEQLAEIFGGNLERILQYKKEYHHMQQRSGVSEFVFYTLLYSILEEMVITPIDFFARRTGWLYFNPNNVQKYGKLVTDAMQHFMAWTDEERDAHLDALWNEYSISVCPCSFS